MVKTAKGEKRILLLSFLGLNVLDAAFTIHLVLKTGLFNELNPLFDFLLRKDVLLFAAIKLALSVAITWCLGRFDRTTRILRALVAFFGILVFWQIIFVLAAR